MDWFKRDKIVANLSIVLKWSENIQVKDSMIVYLEHIGLTIRSARKKFEGAWHITEKGIFVRANYPLTSVEKFQTSYIEVAQNVGGLRYLLGELLDPKIKFVYIRIKNRGTDRITKDKKGRFYLENIREIYLLGQK